MVLVKFEREERERINQQIAKQMEERPQDVKESFKRNVGTRNYRPAWYNGDASVAASRRANLRKQRADHTTGDSKHAKALRTEAAQINEILRIKAEVRDVPTA